MASDKARPKKGYSRRPSKAGTIVTFISMLTVVSLLVACRTVYPEQTSTIFHIPPELDPVSATELMLLRIAVLATFVRAIYRFLRDDLCG